MTPIALPERTGPRRSNLAFALTCLPADRRRDALVFYDFCRTIDDIADDPALPVAQKRDTLLRWREAIEYGTPPAALAEVITRRALDTHLLLEIIRGVEMDLTVRTYETWDELRVYCWRVACAVGLVSLDIFGCRHPDSRAYAENLGLALQLTNILRDVHEDARMERVYLPREDLARFEVTADSLRAGRPSGDFTGLMQFEAERARGFYAAARKALPASDARRLAPAETMRDIYQAILEGMERDNFRVFEKSYRLSAARKILFLLRNFLRAFAAR